MATDPKKDSVLPVRKHQMTDTSNLPAGHTVGYISWTSVPLGRYGDRILIWNNPDSF